MTGMSLSSSFLPILANNLDPSGVLVGLVVSSWFFSRIFIEIPAGIISDRIGRRRLLVIGLALSFFGSIICSQANHIYILIFGRVIWGMGTALFFMSNMVLLMDILPPVSRGRALGIFQGFEFLGSFIGAPIGAFLATIISFTQVFYFTSFFMLASFIVAFRSRNIRNLKKVDKIREQLNLGEILRNLRNKDIILICFCNLFRMFTRFGIYMTVLQLYLNQILGLSVSDIGWVISMRIAGMVLFLFVAGSLSDKYGRRPVIVTGYLISGVALLAFSMSGNMLLILLSSGLAGVGDALEMTTLMALLTDIALETTRGAVVGLFRTFQDIGGFLGPIIFMIVFTEINPDSTFYLGALLSLVNIILITKVQIHPQ
jgi:DHA1 family multidrug resistance protein-like MFS transporter